MADRLGSTRQPVCMPIAGVGGAKFYARAKMMVYIESRHSEFSTSAECLVVPRVTGNIPASKIDISSWPIPSGIHFADPEFNKPDQINMLIGASIFFRLLKTGQIHLADGLPELHETHFGWIFAGVVDDGVGNVPKLVHSASLQTLKETMKNFWEIEELPATSPSTEPDDYENTFRLTHYRTSEGRYVVKLPFRDNLPDLQDNRSFALRRFFMLERRFKSNPILKEQYVKFIEEYLTLGHCREVDVQNDSCSINRYYMPHHAVLRPSTKLRVVFDGSGKPSSCSCSLNDVLKVGGTVQKDLFTILLSFRQYVVAFTADITKMYRQILIDPSQTSYQRIFWRSDANEPLKVLELLTVTYGTAAAPFLATRCLTQLCDDEQEQFPVASNIVKKDCYVDDVLSGAESVEKALQAQREIQEMLARGGFPIHKWSSNRQEVLDQVPEEDREKLVPLAKSMGSEIIKTLGMSWCPTSDEFLFVTSFTAFDTNIVRSTRFGFPCYHRSKIINATYVGCKIGLG
ncbi:uncharacterized protein LOC129720047 [Wyeomyia smithii]|uniref:uncharacterized protein LOC129720047 n=1 Tax=Wyeomyia smithii TaxID=174621 RepID=UPI002467FE2B|nr:uncharacterized protein LOC129720047 [Wyeomyia smithii]